MGVEIQLSFTPPPPAYSSHSSGASTATTESGGAAPRLQLPAMAAGPGRLPASVVTTGDKAVTSRSASAQQQLQSSSSSSSRYKGVVPQPNGRWGAQIYERHARVWLGKSHEDIVLQ